MMPIACPELVEGGNLTGDGSNAYTYDIENRLVSASGASSAALRYDPLGRLYETSGGAAGTTRFLYDGDELVAEYNSGGGMLRRYVHGSGVDDPMAWFEGAGVAAGVAKLIKTNHQGSVIALTDWWGNLTNINSYDEYGIPGATNTGRFQYTGQAWIGELGMYYYKARIYSPTLGRFMQTDPIGYKDQMNLYAYVGNDPVNKTDPTGMYRCNGNKDDCTAFKSFLTQLDRAIARSWQNGARLPSPLLTVARKFYGSDDGKGPSVEFSSIKGSASGQYNASTNTVTFDMAKISKIAENSGLSKALVGGEVAAHEGTHGDQRLAPRNGREHYWMEVHAYSAGGAYYRALNISDPSGYPTSIHGSQNTSWRNIRSRAMASCTSGASGGANERREWYNQCATENAN